jgi:hypothetical protein
MYSTLPLIFKLCSRITSNYYLYFVRSRESKLLDGADREVVEQLVNTSFNNIIELSVTKQQAVKSLCLATQSYSLAIDRPLYIFPDKRLLFPRGGESTTASICLKVLFYI